MKLDPTLFGTGAYPKAGPVAVVARLAFFASVIAIVAATLLPPDRVPNFTYSHNLQHFAAFFVLTICATCAMPSLLLRTILMAIIVFATSLETFHLLNSAPRGTVFESWIADLGGAAAATSALLAERLKQRLKY